MSETPNKVNQRAESCAALFAKPPIPGRVKTRLVGALSAEQAAELYAAFLADALAELARGPFELAVAWAVEGGEALPELPATAALERFAQRGEGLGERLVHGLSYLAERYPRVAAVGSDHPELGAPTVAEAFERLAVGAEVVIGPSEDGGYYLIAMRREALVPRLFEDVPWSTGAVLSTTLERCHELGLRYELLAEGHDVDRPSDLDRLARRLARGEVECPRTRDLLQRWGRLDADPFERGN